MADGMPKSQFVTAHSIVMSVDENGSRLHQKFNQADTGKKACRKPEQ